VAVIKKKKKQSLYYFWNLVTIAIDINSSRCVNLKGYSRIASDYLHCKSSGLGDFQQNILLSFLPQQTFLRIKEKM
jgi:hypothetical protein